MQWFRVITNMSKAATTDFFVNSEGRENVYLVVL